MLIAISGSQGTGKSTLITEMEKYGFKSIKRKVARSIIDDWGIPLNEINNSVELTIKFQMESIKRKHEDELIVADSTDKWLTERSYADLFSYALINLGKDNNCNEWINEYYELCKSYQPIYKKIFYIAGGQFPVANDGVRSINTHYSKMSDLIIYEYTRRTTSGNTLITLGSSNMQYRVDMILDEAGAW